jgi:hypothetical protein
MAKAIEDFGGVIMGHVTLMQWGQGWRRPGRRYTTGTPSDLTEGQSLGQVPRRGCPRD